MQIPDLIGWHFFLRSHACALLDQLNEIMSLNILFSMLPLFWGSIDMIRFDGIKCLLRNKKDLNLSQKSFFNNSSLTCPPTHLHLIFDIHYVVQLDIFPSLKYLTWKCSLFPAWIHQATDGRNIKLKLEKVNYVDHKLKSEIKLI